MVLLSHLLALNWQWSRAKIRLIRVIEDAAGREPTDQALRELVNSARVNAEVQVLVSEGPFCEILHRHSSDASLVLLGFNVPEENEAQDFYSNIQNILSELPTALLVHSSGEADLFA